MSARKKIVFYVHNPEFAVDKILGKFPLAGNHFEAHPSFLTDPARDSVEAALQVPKTAGTVTDQLGEEVHWKIIKE
jgi:hypothetical protein